MVCVLRVVCVCGEVAAPWLLSCTRYRSWVLWLLVSCERHYDQTLCSLDFQTLNFERLFWREITCKTYKVIRIFPAPFESFCKTFPGRPVASFLIQILYRVLYIRHISFFLFSFFFLVSLLSHTPLPYDGGEFHQTPSHHTHLPTVPTYVCVSTYSVQQS